MCIVCCHCDCLIVGRVMWYEWLFFVGVGVQEEPCSSFWELGLQRWFAIHAVLWVSEAGWVASIQLFWGSWFVCGWWLVPEWCDDSGHDCRASSNGTFLCFSNSKILFFFFSRVFLSNQTCHFCCIHSNSYVEYDFFWHFKPTKDVICIAHLFVLKFKLQHDGEYDCFSYKNSPFLVFLSYQTCLLCCLFVFFFSTCMGSNSYML